MRASVLNEIERDVLSAVGRPLTSFGLMVPAISSNELHDYFTNMSLDPIGAANADRDISEQRRDSLNISQLDIFNMIRDKLSDNQNGIIYVNASAGAGKTYLINTIIHCMRLDINCTSVIATAASACAALIIFGARTVHTTFKVPLNINCDSMCNISRGTELANKISSSSLIIIDECTLLHRYVYYYYIFYIFPAQYLIFIMKK